MGDLLGYARVSTSDQNPKLQIDVLEKAGCLRVFADTASGAMAARPEVSRLVEQLRLGPGAGPEADRKS